MTAAIGRGSDTGGDEGRNCDAGQTQRDHTDRRRRLDLRAVARGLLSGEAGAEARARICERQADLDRGERPLLRLAEAGELREMARGDPGQLQLGRASWRASGGPYV